MLKPSFHHFPLELINPPFESPLVDLVTELDHLRRLRISGSTKPFIFFQLKRIFHILESIGSARIEGNNTTIAEYIETEPEGAGSAAPSIQEIRNLEKAMDFIEKNIENTPINKAFVNELHKRIVDGLPITKNGEGDLTPGEFRKIDISISKSTHIPPEPIKIDEYMEELFKFINTAHSPKYDLLKVALAHHRFLWIHPFGNGNGRTVRMFTYAMLIKSGFNVAQHRILNPTAVFCSDRDQYYNYLSAADTGKTEDIEKWCYYVLKGLKDEIEKIDRLLDYNFLKINILLPSVAYSHERGLITEIEFKILKRAIEKQVIQAGDLHDIFSGKHRSEISRQIAKIIEKKMLSQYPKSPRKYFINFGNIYLRRGIINALGKNGFLSDNQDI